MDFIPEKLLVVSGGGAYPKMLIDGARAAGVGKIDLIAVRGSTDRATAAAADEVHWIRLNGIFDALEWSKSRGYDGAILVGQINPLSLFSAVFDEHVRAWLDAMPSKNAHAVYGKLTAEFESRGVRIFPASSFMDGHLPGEGVMTSRAPTDREWSDIRHASEVARDVGRHDVGQTVLVKDGMVLAVEAFEGTNAAIKRGGKLGGKGSTVFKAAREGHDMRFDIPVVGMKTLKEMKSAGASVLAFQAGRLVMLERDDIVRYANAHGISVVGVKTDLPPAPLRPVRA